jgi:flagellar M-ring protein FliF
MRASVHVEYDLSTSEDTQETYDPTKSAALSTQKSEETAGGAPRAGFPARQAMSQERRATRK